jgi:hypothetical protein
MGHLWREVRVDGAAGKLVLHLKGTNSITELFAGPEPS